MTSATYAVPLLFPDLIFDIIDGDRLSFCANIVLVTLQYLSLRSTIALRISDIF